MTKLFNLLSQKVFLSRVLDFYLETRQPLHYSTIAQQLGLSNSTAYDMLRLLEGKGMVSSEYVMPSSTVGKLGMSILAGLIITVAVFQGIVLLR